ncbi:hypothetical protein OHT76_38010 [Streptomyces sp. NBC_00287]|uniref:hypothetical protein n=1 Tax=Streptomyces sp. NBC_00287 TaxID=2975702 RepID=UPI002E2C321C|nr:hypothetical protein [Streptomyces sp. NBC_00287]
MYSSRFAAPCNRPNARISSWSAASFAVPIPVSSPTAAPPLSSSRHHRTDHGGDGRHSHGATDSYTIPTRFRGDLPATQGDTAYTGDAITLTFHFWSGATVTYQVTESGNSVTGTTA